jgi:hypothetical protein
MNHEEEYAQEIERLRIENAELKSRVEIAEKQVADAKIAVQGYIDELVRIGASTKELLKQMGTIQDQGNAVRTRLAKVNVVLVAADNLVNVYRSNYPTPEAARIAEAEKAYTEARKQLETSDAQQSEQQPAGRPDVPVPNDRR